MQRRGLVVGPHSVQYGTLSLGSNNFASGDGGSQNRAKTPFRRWMYGDLRKSGGNYAKLSEFLERTQMNVERVDRVLKEIHGNNLVQQRRQIRNLRQGVIMLGKDVSETRNVLQAQRTVAEKLKNRMRLDAQDTRNVIEATRELNQGRFSDVNFL